MSDLFGRKNQIPMIIGLSAVNASYDEYSKLDILGYPFKFIQKLNPERNSIGKIRQFYPHILYEKRQNAQLHRYGLGPFCHFTISNEWSGVCGVYAVCDSQQLLYIGQCIDLAKRYNSGYGNISPRNCFIGGQQTNCKINAMVLKKYLEGGEVYLYFYETKDFDRVEHKLISRLTPPLNERV
ncbi:MAG TPA: GIY-YIG nuclease family protein [Oscillospiraceae bacterium]|nr:GIY-YIG nuclease family protein [Oscillospiraceae bacterium]